MLTSFLTHRGPSPLFLDLFILKVLRERRLEVRILKDLFAQKQGNN